MEYPIIENERIILKQVTNKDKQEVFNHFSNDKVNKYVDFDSVVEMDEAIEIIDWGHNLSENNKGILWGIFRKSISGTS